ncbi:pyrroline-5-carboxylate reductase [Sporomusaceae bacterium BoRhaA]|uniref:pyrroline-5-carboxylate reductase family protein n=1 Tax=Pelorhabdus rhamnosifermentans TaxID=2772457 RepID=UPI001C05FAF0|nr:NAD(P)-binding domain-containing protein [Pelorhabdus rhamnosifermentans]MBU2702798.1 pyrroline-5-carboxylate reductase [Pelorhabdus rhamnosifermentans]
MNNLDSNVFNHIKIGIIGCGHLGQAILESLINHGFFKENIFVSYKGNSSTYKKIKQLGLAICISENEKIFNEADVVFVTTKPQDVICFKEILFSENTIVVSCLAGVSVEILKNIFKTHVCRIMLSGPDTIVAAKGVAAVYPYNKLVGCILNKMNLRIFEISDERDMDIFTTGVCLPAALLQEDNEETIKEAINEIEKDCAMFLDLYAWAKKILPSFNTESEKVEYITRMVTKGGITEAIIDSLKAGDLFITALRKGITRSKDISLEISNFILN